MHEELKSLMRAAGEAEESGDFALAVELYNQILTKEPRSRQVFLLRCLALAKQGQSVEAISGLEKHLVSDPASLVALNWLSALLRESGQFTSALAYSERAAKLNQSDPETVYNLGLCYFALQHFEEAVFCLERSTELLPHFAPGYYALACVYETIGQPWSALIAMKANIEIHPYPEGFLKLGQIYLSVGDLPNAIECGQRALEKATTSTDAHLLLASAIADSDPSESRKHYELAVAQNPELAESFDNGRAKRLTRLGRFDEALEINLRMLDRTPQSGVAYLNVVALKKINTSEACLVESMETFLGKEDLSTIDRISLHYALGKAFDNLGEFESAMEHFDEANALNRVIFPALANFDRKRFARRVDSLIGLFSKEFLSKNALPSEPYVRPIFILGMMRSGTTLVEQIMSNHSRVIAGGELAHWPYSERKVVDFSVKQIHTSGLMTVKETYLRLLRQIDPDADHVTDKNPANCFAVGSIALAFPGAHILYMVRDPIETALSIYMTPTKNPPAFGGDRENIAFAIRQTRRLMRHWQSVLPPNTLHEVSYEELVTNQEIETRKLIAACDLPWEDACLHPERNTSMVGTPSMWQVRQAVNRTAVDRSKNYAPWLGAFNKLLQN